MSSTISYQPIDYTALAQNAIQKVQYINDTRQQGYLQQLQEQEEMTGVDDEYNTADIFMPLKRNADAISRAQTPYAPTVDETRRKLLQARSENNRERITGENQSRLSNLEYQMRLQGRSEEEIQTKLNEIKNAQSKDDYERMQAYENNPEADPEFTEAINELSLSEVESRYVDRPLLVEYIKNKKNQLLEANLKATGIALDGSAETWLNPTGIASTLASGLAETTMAVEGVSAMAIDDPVERLKAYQRLNQKDSITGSLNNWANKNMTGAQRMSVKRAEGQQQGRDWLYEATRLKALSKGKSAEEAEREANSAVTSRAIDDYLNNDMQVTREGMENLADVGLGIATGGATAVAKKGLVETGKAIVKAETKSLINKVGKQNISHQAKQQAKKAIIESGKKQEAKIAKALSNRWITKGAVMTQQGITTGLQNAPEGYQNASQAIMAMNPTVVASSPEGQKLRESDPNLTDQEIQQLLADKAGSKAYKNVAWQTGLVGVLGGLPEAKLASRMFDKNFKGGLKSYLSSVGTSSVTEGIEEDRVKHEANKAINNTLGAKYVDENKGRGESAILGALAGGTSTSVINSPELFSKGIQNINDVRQNKKAEKQQEHKTEAGSNLFSQGTINTINKNLGTSFGSGSDVRKQVKSDIDTVTSVSKMSNPTSEEIKNKETALKNLQTIRDAYNNELIEIFARNNRIAQYFDDLQTGKILDETEAQAQIRVLFEENKTDILRFNPNLEEELNQLDEIKQGEKMTLELAKFNANGGQLQQMYIDRFAPVHEIEQVLFAQNQTTVNPKPLSKIKTAKDISLNNGKVTITDNDGSSEEFSIDEVKRAILTHVRDSIETGKVIPAGSEKNTLYTSLDNLNPLIDLVKKFDANVEHQDSSFSNFVSALERLKTNMNKQSASVSDVEAKVLQEALFGSKDLNNNVNKGLFDYIKSYVNNGGKLSASDMFNLNNFLNTQRAKRSAVANVIAQMKKDKENGELIGNYTADAKSLRGSKVTFKTIEQATNYLNKVDKLFNEFTAMQEALLNGAFSFKGKPKQQQQTETKSTADTGSNTDDNTKPATEPEKKNETVQDVPEIKQEEIVSKPEPERTEVIVNNKGEIEEVPVIAEQEPTKTKETKSEVQTESVVNEGQEKLINTKTEETEEVLVTDETEIEEENKSSSYTSAVISIKNFGLGNLTGIITSLGEDYNVAAQIASEASIYTEDELKDVIKDVINQFQNTYKPFWNRMIPFLKKGTKPQDIPFDTSQDKAFVLTENQAKNASEKEKQFIQLLTEHSFEGYLASSLASGIAHKFNQIGLDNVIETKTLSNGKEVLVIKPEALNKVLTEISTEFNDSIGSIKIADVSVKSNESMNLRNRLIHNLLNQDNNKQKIGLESKSKSEADNYPVTYKVDGKEYSIPMWLATEMSLKGISLTEDVSKQFKEQDYSDHLIYKYFEDITEGKFSKVIKELGQKESQELLDYFSSLQTQIQSLQQHLTSQTFSLLKDSSIDFRIGMSGLLNLVHLSEDEKGNLEVTFPKEVVVSMLSGLVHGIRVFNNHTKSQNEVTEEFLENQGEIKVYDISEGVYMPKEVYWDGYSLGSNYNALARDIGSYTLSTLGLGKETSKNTVLGLQAVLGNEILNFMHETGLTSMYEVRVDEGNTAETASQSIPNIVSKIFKTKTTVNIETATQLLKDVASGNNSLESLERVYIDLPESFDNEKYQAYKEAFIEASGVNIKDINFDFTRTQGGLYQDVDTINQYINSIRLNYKDYSLYTQLFVFYHELGHAKANYFSKFLGKSNYTELMDKFKEDPFIQQLVNTYNNLDAYGQNNYYLENPALYVEEVVVNAVASLEMNDWEMFADYYGIKVKDIPNEWKEANKPESTSILSQIYNLLKQAWALLKGSKKANTTAFIDFVKSISSLRTEEFYQEHLAQYIKSKGYPSDFTQQIFNSIDSYGNDWQSREAVMSWLLQDSNLNKAYVFNNSKFHSKSFKGQVWFLPTVSKNKSFTFIQAKWNTDKVDTLKGSVKSISGFKDNNVIDALFKMNSKDTTHQVIYHKDNPVEIKSNKQKTEFTEGTSSDLKEALDVFNNQEWKINLDLYNLDTNLGDLYGLATEVTDENKILTERGKQSASSIASHYKRIRDNLRNAVEAFVNTGSKIEDWRMRGEYEVTSNMRIMMKSQINPQNHKFDREMMDLVIRDENGNEYTPSFDITNFNQPEAFNKLGKKILESNDPNLFMFGLAVAQALGIKVERLSFNEIFTKLDEKLSDETIANMYELIGKGMKGKVDVTSNKETAIAFKEQFGNGGYRAIKALMYLNQMMNNKGNFSPMLFIEADGIGNGMHNIFMQFSTSLSEDLFKTLTKTGVLTLDRIVEEYKKSEGKESLKEVMERLQGSAQILSKELSNDVPKDVYEDISLTMSKDIHQILNRINTGLELIRRYGFEPKGETINSLVRNDIVSTAFEAIKEARDNRDIKSINAIQEMLDSITTISVLTLSGNLTSETGSFMSQNLNEVPSKVDAKFSNAILAEISRNFAKDGVTPATYGGKLKGIASQLLKSFISDITAQGDKLLQQIEDNNINNEDWNLFIINAINAELVSSNENTSLELRHSIKDFIGSNQRLEEIFKTYTKEELTKLINAIVNRVSNKMVIENNIQHSVAKLLNSAVQTVYGSALDNANDTLALSESLFEEFNRELTDKVADKIEQRNLKKGYAKWIGNELVITDPRGYDGLSKQEYKSIFKTMDTLPVVATAFSDNDQLLSELVGSGNSLVKTYVSGDQATSVYSAYRNNRVKSNLNAFITNTLRKYEQAGASIFTSTVVSTESKSQTQTQKLLASQGKASLDVYDGNDAYIWFAKLIGEQINKASFEAHQNYSVMEAMYNLYVQSSLTKVANADTFNKKAPSELTPEVKSQVLLIKGLNSLGRFGKNSDKVSKAINEVLYPSNLQEQKSVLITLHNLIGKNLSSKFDEGLIYLAQGVAQHKAVMAVLNKIPLKYNQFAGANRGVALNAEGELADRLINQAQAVTLNPANLGDFLLKDQELKALYEKTEEDTLKNLLKHSYKVQTVKQGESLGSILEQAQSELDDSVRGKVYKAVFSMAQKWIDTPVYRTKEDFLKKYQEMYSNLPDNLKEAYNSPSEIKAQLESSEAMYLGGVGIYLPEGATLESLAHELLHVTSANGIWDSVVNQSDDKDLQHLVLATRSILENLSKRVIGSKEFNKLLEELSTATEVDVNQAYQSMDALQASVLNYKLAFEIYPQRVKEGLLTEESVREFQALALSEFLSYGLSNQTAIEKLTKIKTTEKTQSLLAFFARVIQQTKNLVMSWLGLSPNNALYRSELNSLLEVATLFSVHKKVNNATKPNSKVALVNNIKNSNQISATHKQFLVDIVTGFQQVVQQLNETGVTESGQTVFEYSQLRQHLTKSNSTVPNILRGKGFTLSSEEEDVYNIILKLLELNKETKQPEIFTEFSKIINDLSLLPASQLKGITEQQLEDLLKATANNPNKLIAIALASEEINSSITQSIKSIGKQKLTLKSFKQKLLGNMKSSKTLDELGSLITEINLKNITKFTDYERRLKEASEQDAKDIKLNDEIQRLTQGKPLLDFLGTLAIAVNSGKDLGTYARSEIPLGESSIIGKLIDEVVNWDIRRAGRPTALSTFISWFRGESPDMHIIGELHASHLVRTDVVRQRQKDVLKGILEELVNEPKSEESNKAIKSIVRSSLVSMVQLNPNFDFNKLSDKHQIQQEISVFEKGLKDIIDTEITANAKTKTQIFNYLKWQYQGLAELQLRNQAKSSKGVSHNILPNTKVIASLKQLEGIVKFTGSNDLEKLLQNQLDNLVAFKSVELMDANEFTNLNKFFKDNQKTMFSILTNIALLNTSNSTYLGRNGHMNFTYDPDYDVRVSTTDDQDARFEAMGYKAKAVLSDGSTVYSTDGNARNNYTTGVFSFTEKTVNGVNVSTYKVSSQVSMPYNDYETRGILPDINSDFGNAINDPNYYESLTTISNVQPIINEKGEILTYETTVPYKLQESLLPTQQNSIDNLSSMYARSIEEHVVAKENIRYFDELQRLYQRSKDKRLFVKVDGNLTPKSNSRLDKNHIEVLNNFYKQLPQSTIDHIEKNGGLYIPLKEIPNIVGYHQWNLSDVFTDKTNLPEPMKVMLRSLFSAIASVTGQNPVKLIRSFEQYLKEVVSLGKDFILNRSMTVPVANMISNVVHLVQWGIDPRQINGLVREGYTAVKQYQETLHELDKIRIKLRTASPSDKIKLKARNDLLQNQLRNSIVRPLIQSGLLTSISSFETDEYKADYSKLSKLSNRTGLTKLQNQMPNVAKEFLLRDGSSANNFFNEFLNYGDFIAKYILYKHLLKQGKSEFYALNIVREEFIDYSRNRGAFFDMLNKYGLTYFLNYKLAIQKIIFRSFRRNFLRTSAIMATDIFIPTGLDPIGLYQTVPSQFIGLGNLVPFGSYQTSPHLIDAFESHYLSQLVKWLL